MPIPDFSPGEVLTSSVMDSVGLWKIASGNFSTGVTNFQINNIFSSDFRSYRILFRGVKTSGANGTYIQLRNSGGTSAVSYFFAGLYRLYNGTGGDNTLANGANWLTCFSDNTDLAFASIDIHNPNVNAYTGYVQQVANFDAGAFITGIHKVNAQYTGLNVYTNSAATFTAGNYSVYAYRD